MNTKDIWEWFRIATKPSWRIKHEIIMHEAALFNERVKWYAEQTKSRLRGDQ